MSSTGRSSLLFGLAVAGSNLAQLAWLAAGSKSLDRDTFGTVLAAQALYGVLQLTMDNGTAFLGARNMAKQTLTDDLHAEIVSARLRIALVVALVGLGIAAIGGVELVTAFAPFAGALGLFAILDVWSPYGAGRVAPYAAYLLLRSLILAVVAGTIALAGGAMPAVAVGACEISAIAIVGTGFSVWTRPQLRRVMPGTWRAVRNIGLPAILTQYNAAAATVILGVAGQTSAAAVTGVVFRLLTGLQGLNGAIAAALFPRLAQLSDPGTDDLRAVRTAGAGIVGLSVLGLLAAALVAPQLVSLLVGGSSAADEQAIVFGLGAVAAYGLTMHSSFALVANGDEAAMLSASLLGAGVVSVGAVAATVVGGTDAPVIAAAGFVASQVLTLSALYRHRAARNAGRPALFVVAAVLSPLVAATLALLGPDRVVPAAVLIVTLVAVAPLAVRRMGGAPPEVADGRAT